MNEEVVLGVDPRTPLTTQFRSTWLAGSLRALKSRGLYEAYLGHLQPATAELIVGSVAGVWLPADVAVEHYEACDRLGIQLSEQIEIGREVTRFAHTTVLDTMVKLATGLGVTPWTLLSQLDRLWKRIWIGGAVGVVKIGPKDARVEIVGWSCARVPYCRNAINGVLLAITELVSRRAYVTFLPNLSSETKLAYRLSWA